jgi:hypothetical protein
MLPPACFYGTLYAFFDRRLWRHPLMRKLGLVKTPNLAGQWQGYLTSSFDNHARRYDFVRANRPELDANLRLPQYSHVCLVELRGSDSSLRSRWRRVDHQYENQPLADATRTMHIHFGTAMLRVSDGNKLTGDYYAGRDRRTFGRISCCRLPRTIKQALGAMRPRLTGSSSHQ